MDRSLYHYVAGYVHNLRRIGGGIQSTQAGCHHTDQTTAHGWASVAIHCSLQSETHTKGTSVTGNHIIKIPVLAVHIVQRMCTHTTVAMMFASFPCLNIIMMPATSETK